MKKLSVEEEVKRGLITAKYQYPAYCTAYNKDGSIKSRRTVTHNLKDTIELQKLYPQLAAFINTYEDDEIVPKHKTVKEEMTALGK
jgi:uncharacterized protein YprB with RNaseH-like and TPR domain